jgi:uncharacterized DUF497 family protein
LSDILPEWDRAVSKPLAKQIKRSFEDDECWNRLLVVVHADRIENIRIVSARKATKKERRQYEENAKRSRHA